MTDKNYYALINAGGSGTRFWPLSTEETPKQFTSLVTDNTLIQDTVARVEKIIPIERIFINCNKNHVKIIKEQIPVPTHCPIMDRSRPVPTLQAAKEPVNQNTTENFSPLGQNLVKSLIQG